MSSPELFWIKVAFAVAVAAVGLAGALLPWSLGGRGSSARVLALSDTFAGGVLGGAGLIHLLSGGIEQFRVAAPSLTYPLALLLAGAGFLMILLIEGVIVPMAGLQAQPGGQEPVAVQHETGWSPSQTGAAAYPVVLLVVLSVHSVILGLALGAQRGLTGAVVIFLAIVAHKGAAGFALGVGYARAGVRRWRAAPEVAFFAAMTPIGILVGAVAGTVLAAHAGQLFEATFDSIGAGTFIYIATLDIIKTEFDSPTYRAQKWLSAVVGFGIMALLAIWL